MYFFDYRLTKYPLLFESLVKCTVNSDELSNIKRAFERSKIILNHVNQAVREAEDEVRLLGIQKKLDATPFEKVDHPLSTEYKVRNNISITIRALYLQAVDRYGIVHCFLLESKLFLDKIQV